MYLFFMNISDIVQYLQDIYDAGKEEISCAIRGDSQLKINVLHDILHDMTRFQDKTSLLIAMITIL